MKQLHIENWINKALALMAALTLILVAILGVGMEMNMGSSGSMTGCLFMNHQGALCPMNALEHIAKWQEIFNAIPSLKFAYASIFILLLLYVLPSLSPIGSKQGLEQSPHALARNNALLASLDYIMLAFSQGLLHPKIYRA